jgi:hypothetical protein
MNPNNPNGLNNPNNPSSMPRTWVEISRANLLHNLEEQG